MQLPLQTQDLNLSRCSEIPSDAWEALQTANWSNLKKASFEQRLGQEKGASCIVLLVLITDVRNTPVRTFVLEVFGCEVVNT